MSLFLMNIKKVLNCPVATVLKIDIAPKLKICPILHVNVVNVIVIYIKSFQKILTNSFSIYSALFV